MENIRRYYVGNLYLKRYFFYNVSGSLNLRNYFGNDFGNI